MVALQIHLTEPCLILPGAPNEAVAEPRNDGENFRPSLGSGITSPTMMNQIKQRPRLSSSTSQLSDLWPGSVLPVQFPRAANEEAVLSTAELNSRKTSMIRGFVVLHVSQAINLNRLSIKFSGSTHTTGPESVPIVPSGNSTILIAEEYTITDASLISSEGTMTSRVPPYISDSVANLGRETGPATMDRADEAPYGTSIAHNNHKALASTIQNSTQSLEERGRQPRVNISRRRSLSLGARKMSHYFHRRSRSACSLDKRTSRIPLEADTQTGTSTARSSFVMVNKSAETEELFPMYQDSAFHDMLANQYNLLSEEGLASNEPLHSSTYSPTDEAHYHSPVSPKSHEKNSTEAANVGNTKTSSKHGSPSCSRNRGSLSFKSSIAQFMGALKSKRSSSSSSSNSLDLRKVTSANASRKNTPPPPESTRSSRRHSTIGQQPKETSKNSCGAKNGFGWGRSNSRRRNSSIKKSDSKNNNTYQRSVRRDSLANDPFRVSEFSTSIMHVPKLPKASLLKPGVYKYPVVVPVPNHLPPSMACKSGSISYSLEARLAYQDVQDSTFLTTHQQIPIALVDPLAGSPSLNPSQRLILSGEEDAVNEVYSSYSGVNIERTWEDQLYYQIRMDTRKFLVGGKIGFEIQFNPLSRIKIYRFQAEIEEKTQYFMDHDKQYLRHCESHSFNLVKLEQTSPIVLIRKEADDRYGASKLRASDVPLLPIITSDPIFVSKSPLLPHVQVNPASRVDYEDGCTDGTRKWNAVSELSTWSDQSGPWNLAFDLRLPGCHSSSSNASERGDKHLDKPPRGLNFTCQHSKSPIVVKHYLRLRMRVERGDDQALDKRGRRKKYDIILSSPIQILSCQCKPYSLPAYASSDPTDMSEILSIFREINAAKDHSSPSLQCNCIARVE
ncbi:hypothetical protein VP01_611g2 [Puccinia sorghi]|uniref:Arrestin C-terminal-like domain-containing protein n=1 Tax=Puccinia sorghi TaxID=27349 RepID=A0A0L6UJ25_9BASI|nr:hypothetical protein VP01_611g2 [Puccinia sorghi]